jgi:hypothetical protein
MFSVRYEMDFYILSRRNSVFKFSSERMLRKDYNRKGSVAKKHSGREPQRAWRQDELFGVKPPVVKLL